MTFFAFILIVFSACLHASWNLLAKRSAMTVAFYTVICCVAATCWCHVQFWTPLAVWQMPRLFYIYILCSIFSDLIYCTGLVRAYRTMEMSTAYPMMRSLPLLFTAAITSLAGWGASLNVLALLGMLVVFIGCMVVPMKDFRSFNWRDYLNGRMFFIVLVACGTTGYTIFDSLAQKIMLANSGGVSKTVVSPTYYTTRGVLLGIVLWCYILNNRSEKANFRAFFTERNWAPLLAGVAAGFTYVLVLMAMNYVSNVSYVQVFRQVGLIIGMSFGIIFLKEKCTATKVVGVSLILIGLAMTVIK